MRRSTFLAAAMAGAVALTGCAGGKVRTANEGSGGASAPADTPTTGGGSVAGTASTAPGTSSATGQTFVYSNNLDIITDWDPATSYSDEIIAMQNIYESLTRYDPTMKKVLPRLATSWTSSNGAKTWTFTLRSGATFHSGRPVTSTAAKAAIERTMKLKGGPAYIWDAVAEISTPNPTTLVFTLKYPTPLDLVSSSDYGAYVYDVHAAGAADLKTWLGKGAAGQDAGSGPYTIDTWHRGQSVELRLTAYQKYWGGWSGSRYAALEFWVTPQVTTAWQLLQRGEVDFVNQLNPQLFAAAQKTPSLKTSTSTSFQNLLALFNTAGGPLADVRVRKAVQQAIDTTGLVSALKGSVLPASGIVPEGLLGYTPGLTLTQNLAGAKALLAQAGYGSGGRKLSLTLTYAEGDDSQQLFVTLLTSALSGLGVHLDARPQNFNAQWSQAKSSDPAKRQDIFIFYWYPDYADAYSWLVNVFHSATPPYFNLTYLDDAKVDQQIDTVPKLTATSPATAQATYATLQRELVTSLAVVAPLYVSKYERAYAGTVTGYLDNPAYPGVVFGHDLTFSG